jgi:hypothetical protein
MLSATTLQGVIMGATNRKTKRQADKPHNHDNHAHDQAKIHKVRGDPQVATA